MLSSRSTHVHPGMLDLLDRLPNTPAQVMTDLSVPLVQNRLASALLGAPVPARGFRASYLYRWFTDPAARDRYHPDEHDHQSRVFVADLRAAVGKRGKDQMATDLIAALKGASPEFRQLWSQHEVAVRRADRKRLVHPVLGVIELNCLNLLSEDGRQRLLWFTAPPGSDAISQLELLAVVGTQELGLASSA